jgi:glycosyltransferase involved in cell wall biosynthesis
VRLQIVIPSLNQGRYIGGAIDSVLGQERSCELDVVIVDACSTDETHSVIEESLARWPLERVRVVVEPDKGQSDAINKGIKMGHGEVVGWLNADDRLLPGTLLRWESFWQSAESDGVVVAYGDVAVTDSDGNVVRLLREQDFDRRDLLWGPCYIPQPSTTIARWAWEEADGLRMDLHYAMDLDLWLRLGDLGRIHHIAHVMSEFRRHPTSKSEGSAHAAYVESRQVRSAHAAQELGRMPSMLEMELRHFAVRVKRRLRRLIPR